jgi:hypothetical protein
MIGNSMCPDWRYYAQGYVQPSPAENAESCAQFPPVVRAETMLRESLRDGWIMGEHPVRFLRGNDHE